MALSLINFFKPQPRATVILCRVTEDLHVGYLLWAPCLPCMLSGCSSFPGLDSCKNWQEENKVSTGQSSKVESSGWKSSLAAAMRAKRGGKDQRLNYVDYSFVPYNLHLP